MGKWSEPVILDAPCRGIEGTYARTRDALAALQTKWPKRTGRGYEEAVSTCFAATAGQVGHDQARIAFLHAADEIGAYARVYGRSLT